jgi:energy-coupling factor transporter ATP-binding protein EcfA2
MTPSLLCERAFARLILEEGAGLEVKNVVAAAFDSDEAVEVGLSSKIWVMARHEVAPNISSLPNVFLSSLEVAGFRGICGTAKIEFSAGPGLTLIMGRNGSGKSSFADAFEVMLTGQSVRFGGKGQEWSRGWRNIHFDGAPAIGVSYYIDGDPVPVQVVRQWGAESELSQSTLKVSRSGTEITDYDALRWRNAVEVYRPILSAAEIGIALNDGPASLYDDLDKILGLDQLRVVRDRLVRARKNREVFQREIEDARSTLIAASAVSGDPRAEAVADIIRAPRVDLKALADMVEGEFADGPRIDALNALANLWTPGDGEVLNAATALQAAQKLVDELKLTQLGFEASAHDLLMRALSLYRRSSDPICPVCSADALSAEWYAEAQARLEGLDRVTAAFRAAESGLKSALRSAESLHDRGTIPALHGGLRSYAAGVTAAANWSDSPDNPRDLPAHILDTYGAIEFTFGRIRDEAKEVLSELESNWRPVSEAINAFVAAHQGNGNIEKEVETLKMAENWARDFEDEIRSERFEPISRKAREIWAELRDQSNVSLNEIKMTGTGSRRRLELSVGVDGVPAPSLGVMSQGELHSLFLSLFLPRLTLDESPFRFLIVDDPVQAMDPAKVDGLARVLERSAKTHQVVVFTHDTRLSDAVRRLRIPTTFFSVIRQGRSDVVVEPGKTPARQFMDDATDLLNHKNEMSPEIGKRVIPGLCRGAFEVAFKDMAWTTLLKEGVSHEDCEIRIEAAKKTRAIVDLAVFGTQERGNAYEVLDAQFDRRVVNPLRLAIKYAHQPFKGSLYDLVEQTKTALKVMGAL